MREFGSAKCVRCVSCPWLEGLPQCDEVLCGFKTRDRCNAVTNVETYGTHRRVVSKANTDRMSKVIGELTELYIAVDIPPVVEENSSHALFEGQRKACLRVNDKEHVAAYWHAD